MEVLEKHEMHADKPDVFGPLAPCANCEKTKKTCTFEWLKSQRLLQSIQPQPTTAPAAKRRRTSPANCPGKTSVAGCEPSASEPLDLSGGIDNTSLSPTEFSKVEFGASFADFAGGPTAFGLQSSAMSMPNELPNESSLSIAGLKQDDMDCFHDSSLQHENLFNTSMLPSSFDTGPHIHSAGSDIDSPFTISTKDSGDTPTSTVPRTRKRRRRCSVEPTSNGALPSSPMSLSSTVLSSTNNAFLRESVLKVYQYSFEDALSCWVTERTCPYTLDNPLKSSAGPDWNHIYYRVFRLDRLATSMRGRQLTLSEERAVTKALNLAIYAFAVQRVHQSTSRSGHKFPYNAASSCIDTEVVENQGRKGFPDEQSAHRNIQIDAWHEAQNALLNASGIESFRVVLAHIVFALVRKPLDEATFSEKMAQNHPILDSNAADNVPCKDQEIDICEDLMAKLHIAIEADGPPTHLEQGLRLIQSLRSRLAMSHGKQLLRHRPQTWKIRNRIPESGFDNADRAAVDLLFWLGIMFDTLSAAINRRPLVVPDEDSDLYHTKLDTPLTPNSETVSKTDNEMDTTAWDVYLFSNQDSRLQGPLMRWPCSFDDATALLCDAAPVKVLLFRKITRIQTHITRSHRGGKIEAALTTALSVYTHWNKLYAPFILDCIDAEQIHPHIQSWCICLASHWHLAALLLADLVEIVDENDLGDSTARSARVASDFVAQFRDDNCQAISNIARSICSQNGASISSSSNIRFSLNKDALSMEPWSTVLIRAFAKAGVIFLEADTMLPLKRSIDQGDIFQRTESCVKALWYFGQESDIAISAALVLSNALEKRRSEAQERVNMSCLLDKELWHNIGDFSGKFDPDHTI